MRYYNEDSYQSDDESLSSDMMIVDDLNLDSLEEPKIKKKRIREKLDHLTNEEKLMRRKVKNRISAQSARDRKKSKMQVLEKKIEVLCQDRQKILKENALLKHQNDQIIAENSDLKKRLNEIENRLSLMSRTEKIQDCVAQNSVLPLQSVVNNRIEPDSNEMRSDFKFSSFQSAALVKESQQKNLDAEMRSDQMMSNSKFNKKVHNAPNKELLILIKRLVSLLMIMTTNAKTCSTGSKTVTKICLQQTLKKLRQQLSSQQFRTLLNNVINRQLKADTLKLQENRKLKTGGKYQKAIWIDS